jgi:hypothetical protein
MIIMLVIETKSSAPDVRRHIILLSWLLFCLVDSYIVQKQATAKPRTPEEWAILKAEITEAFSPGAPVQERDLFTGRATEIALLEDAVNQRGRHAIVFGERGVGKTSLVNVLPLVLRRPNKELIYARVNASDSDNFVSLWKKVFKRMSYADENGKTRKISEDFGSELTPDDVQLVLSDFSGNQVPIIVLDEFDLIKDEATTRLVAGTIKALSDYSVNATVIIVGVAEDAAGLIRGHETTRANSLSPLRNSHRCGRGLEDHLPFSWVALLHPFTGDARSAQRDQ